MLNPMQPDEQLPAEGTTREQSKLTTHRPPAPQGWMWANQAGTVMECAHCGHVARGNESRRLHDCEGGC